MATRTEQVTVREAVRKIMEKDSTRGEQLRSLLQASDTKRSDFDAFCVKLVGTVRSSMSKEGEICFQDESTQELPSTETERAT